MDKKILADTRMDEVSFSNFKKEIDERFEGLGLSKNDYDDAILHTKIDLVLYIMVREGIINLEALVGQFLRKEGITNVMTGGYIEEFIKQNKVLQGARR